MSRFAILFLLFFAFARCDEQTADPKSAPEIYYSLSQQVEDDFSSLLAREWVAADSLSPTFGYSNSDVWLKLIPPVTFATDESYIIEISYAQLDYVRLIYRTAEGNVVESESGDTIRFSKRDLPATTFSFQMERNFGGIVFVQIIHGRNFYLRNAVQWIRIR